MAPETPYKKVKKVWTQPAGRLQTTLQALLGRSGLVASRCPACGRVVRGHDAHPAAAKMHRRRPYDLCATCAAELALRTGGFCPLCGATIGLPTQPPELCGACLSDPPPWSSFICHGPYQGLLRDLILGFKFHQGLGRARLLQDLLTTAYTASGQNAPDLLIPVPLHKKRLRWRGYNQSLELALGLAGLLRRPVEPEALVRLRHTLPQSRLNAAERQVNLKNAFVANSKRVTGRSVLLVDDVCTTGSTLRECTQALRSAGAARVDVAVLARA